MDELSPAVAAELREVVKLAQQGNLSAARSRAEAALEQSGRHGAVHALLGMLCCQGGDFGPGIEHLRAALAKTPGDVTIAINLAAALIETGRFQEAAEIASADRADADASLRLWRLRAYALQQAGDQPGAAAAYRRIVTGQPDDWESWNNLGNAYAAAGDGDAAIAALGEAARLNPGSAPVQLNFASSLAEAGRAEEAIAALERFVTLEPRDLAALRELANLLRHVYRDREAAEFLERAVRLEPGDASLHLELAEQYATLWEPLAAERAFREVLRLDPANRSAHIQLALLLEHSNREAEIGLLLAAAERDRVDPGVLHFLRALVHRRNRDFAAGLEELDRVPPDIEPIRQAQLRGEFQDRLGNSDDAFAAFSEMNRLFRLDPSDPVRRGKSVRDGLAGDLATVSEDWARSWQPLQAEPHRPPLFLVGFPRSGTTLLDTMLMGHPSIQVLEERPPLRLVEDALGGIDRLPDLTSEEASALRRRYFDEVRRHVDLRPDTLLVDKSPLHMNKVPLIRRLFPEAKFILALRHPCDVVLSCFITSFRLNDSMSSFVDLDTAAEYYDLSFAYWTRCIEVLPAEVATVRYEDVVEDAEGELRRLLSFTDLEWQPAVLDHAATARARGLISTASYSQVTEKIYARASGRWQRYRKHLEGVLPKLEPWVRRFGYSL